MWDVASLTVVARFCKMWAGKKERAAIPQIFSTPPPQHRGSEGDFLNHVQQKTQTYMCDLLDRSRCKCSEAQIRFNEVQEVLDMLDNDYFKIISQVK